MKRENYNVWFEDGTGLTENAATPKAAVILACAKRINQGKNYNVDFVEDSYGNPYKITSNLELKNFEVA